jgi:hypothetical protein
MEKQRIYRIALTPPLYLALTVALLSAPGAMAAAKLTADGTSATKSKAHSPKLCAAALASPSQSQKHTFSFEEVFPDIEAPYELRVAAAEVLKNEREHGLVIANQDAKALLEAIVNNRFTDDQKARAPQFRNFLDNIIDISTAVGRLRILEKYDAAESVPQSLTDVLAVKAAPEEKKRRFSLPFIGGKKASEQPRLEFLNAEQFARSLENLAPETRLTMLQSSLKNIDNLTYIEFFRILYSLNPENQREANKLLAAKILGRLDFFPLALVEQAHGRLENPILIEHLAATGGQFDLYDLIGLLRAKGFSDETISMTVGRDTHSEDRIRTYVSKRLAELSSVPLSANEAYSILRMAAKSSVDFERMDELKGQLAGGLSSETAKLDLETHFKIIVREFNLEVDLEVANFVRDAKRSSPSADVMLAGMRQFLSAFEGRLKIAHAVKLMSLIPNEHIRPESEKRLLGLRDELRGFSKAEWTASDLFEMNVSLNLTVARRVLSSVAAKNATPDEIAVLNREIGRIFQSSGIRDLRTNPNKPKLPPPPERGVTVNNLHRYFESAIMALGGR